MKTIKLSALEKLTKDCFKDFYYRDEDFDNLLPKKQPKQSGGISIIQLERQMTFLEMAQEYLGTTDVEEIKKHTLTLPMIEKLIKDHEDELATSGWGNFFFVKSNDGVSVGSVDLDERDWDAGVFTLGNDYRWDADNRLLVRNLDTLMLDPVLDLQKRVAILEAVIKSHNL